MCGYPLLRWQTLVSRIKGSGSFKMCRTELVSQPINCNKEVFVTFDRCFYGTVEVSA